MNVTFCQKTCLKCKVHSTFLLMWMNVHTLTSLPSSRWLSDYAYLYMTGSLQPMLKLITQCSFESEHFGKRHMTIWLHGSLQFKGRWKTYFYIMKLIQQKQPADAAPNWSTQHCTQTSRTAANVVHGHIFSLFCVKFQCFTVLYMFQNKQTFSLTVGFPTLITVDNWIA